MKTTRDTQRKTRLTQALPKASDLQRLTRILRFSILMAFAWFVAPVAAQTGATTASSREVLSDQVAALVFGERFVPSGVAGTSGISTDNPMNPSNGLGVESQFRPGSFTGAAETPGQLVRTLNFSTMVGSGTALKVNSVEGSLVPFVSHGPVAGFTANDANGIGFEDLSMGSRSTAPFALNGSRSGLFFLHNLGQTKPTGTETALLFDSSHGLQSQDFSLTGGKFSVGFSRLKVNDVSSPQLLQDVTDTINKSIASRTSLRPVNKSLLSLSNVAALAGVQQRDGYLLYKPGKSLGFGAQFNDIDTPAGNIQLQDYKLDVGKLSLTASRRNVDRTLTDSVLHGMGRDDLIPLKGSNAQEWNALLPLFTDAKGVSKLTITHYRKDETVDTTGNEANVTENHTRKSTVALNPSSRTSFQFIDEDTETGNAVRPEGVDLSHTVSRTYLLTEKISKNTTTSLTRNVTVTDSGIATDPEVRTESTSLHVDTKPFQKLALVGDWNRIDNSKDGATADQKLKVTAPLNKALSLSADWQDKYSELNGLEQHLSYTLNYLWCKTRNLALTSKVDRTGQLTSLKTTRSQTLSLSPWKDTTFEYTFSDTADPTAPSLAQKFTLRQKLIKSLSLVAQHKSSRNITDGDSTVNTYYFDWTRPKAPVSLQIGFESFNFDLSGVASPATAQTDPNQKKPALYTKFTATPFKSLSVCGSYARRRDLTATSLQLWDWSLTKSFGKDWKLTARAFSNQATSDRLADSVLPFSTTYQQVYEQNYSLDFPSSRIPLLPRHFTANLGYSLRKDFGSNAVSDELGLSLAKNLDAKNKLSLKFAHGTGLAAGQPGSYNTITFSYGAHIGDINELSFNCRFTDNAVFAPSTEGTVKGDLTLKRLF